MKKLLKPFFGTLFSIGVLFIACRLIVRALPGDPASAFLEHMDSSISIEAVRAEFHLDLPWYQALFQDLKNILHHGDFGNSLHSRKPVLDELLPRMGRTLALGSLALLIGLTTGITLGIAAARKFPGVQALAAIHTSFSAALPTPWIGPLLAWGFGVHLGVLEPSGDILLPAITLAIGLSAFWSRIVEARLTESAQQGPLSDSVRAARARGLSETRVLFKYSFIPLTPALLAVLGTQLGNLLAGSFVAEVLFDWPGLGSAFVDAVLRRDYPMIEACIFFSGSGAILGTRLGDLLQWVTDPRYQSETVVHDTQERAQ